jgi:hypothetical protein
LSLGTAILWRLESDYLALSCPEGEWEEMMKMTLEMLLVCAEYTKVQVPGLSIVMPSVVVVDLDLELFSQVRSVSGIILPDLTFLTRITV